MYSYLGRTMHVKNEKREEEEKKRKQFNVVIWRHRQSHEPIATQSTPVCIHSHVCVCIDCVRGCAPKKKDFFFALAWQHQPTHPSIYIYWICVQPMKTDKVYYHSDSHTLWHWVRPNTVTHIIHSASESFSVVSKIKHNNHAERTDARAHTPSKIKCKIGRKEWNQNKREKYRIFFVFIAQTVSLPLRLSPSLSHAASSSVVRSFR